jgi:hypothetical protein
MSAFAIGKYLPFEEWDEDFSPLYNFPLKFIRLSDGSAGMIHSGPEEIQLFILFDGHFLSDKCCDNSIPWNSVIFNRLDIALKYGGL